MRFDVRAKRYVECKAQIRYFHSLHFERRNSAKKNPNICLFIEIKLHFNRLINTSNHLLFIKIVPLMPEKIEKSYIDRAW